MFSAKQPRHFCQVAQDAEASLVLASCLPCLCLFGYDTQRYNIIIIKQFFKTFFLRILKIFAEYRTSFDVTPLLPLKNIGPLSMDQL